jgi:DNA (cytosine-5)-methyltransferase 1
MALLNLPANTEHQHVNFPEERLVYYRMLKEGQYWKHLPLDMQEKAMGKSFHLGGGKTGFFRRVSFSKPSPTLVTHPAMPATDLCHPTENRPLSVQEYKLIQEFPSKWEICGSLLDQYKQIGNAVPIALGKAISKTIIAHMNGYESQNYMGFQYSRYKNTDDITWERTMRGQLNKDERQLSLFAI